MSYGDIDLGYHWLMLWLGAIWWQAITWTNVDLSSVSSNDNHLKEILQEILQPWMARITNKITYVKYYWNVSGANQLTHWGRMTHVCISKLNIIGSDNGLSPGRRQAIIWTSAGILLIGPLGTNFSQILIEVDTFLFKKMHLKSDVWKMAAILSPSQCVNIKSHDSKLFLFWSHKASYLVIWCLSPVFPQCAWCLSAASRLHLRADVARDGDSEPGGEAQHPLPRHLQIPRRRDGPPQAAAARPVAEPRRLQPEGLCTEWRYQLVWV